MLIVARVPLTREHAYARNQVTSQVSAPKIVYPTTANSEFQDPAQGSEAVMVCQCARQTMTTGARPGPAPA